MIQLYPNYARIQSSATKAFGVGLKITGKVKEIGTNIPCRVRLFEKISGALVADIRTDDAGHYEFTQLMRTRFFIVAHHPADEFNAIIQDNVVPK